MKYLNFKLKLKFEINRFVKSKWEKETIFFFILLGFLDWIVSTNSVYLLIETFLLKHVDDNQFSRKSRYNNVENWIRKTISKRKLRILPRIIKVFFKKLVFFVYFPYLTINLGFRNTYDRSYDRINIFFKWAAFLFFYFKIEQITIF